VRFHTQETSLLSEKYWLISRDFSPCSFFGYITITLLRLPTCIVRYKVQMNVSGGQLETQKDMAAALSRKTNRRQGTRSHPPEEEEVDNLA
jgi:hypothetical protein